MCCQGYGPTYGYTPNYGCCNSGNTGFGGYGYALILVLFILLVIIGSCRW